MNEQVFTTMTSASSAFEYERGTSLRQHAHHDFAIHEVFGTSQTHKTHFGGTGRFWVWGCCRVLDR